MIFHIFYIKLSLFLISKLKYNLRAFIYCNNNQKLTISAINDPPPQEIHLKYHYILKPIERITALRRLKSQRT